MPFINSIRKSPISETLASLRNFEITGGDEIVTAGGYRIHFFTNVEDSNLSIKFSNNSPKSIIHLQTKQLDLEYAV